jgi:radical SAM superfamily enzyme YgiQ (UPF0313 family)
MAQIILLSDVTVAGDELGYSRSIAPYVLASKARKAGFTSIVIDSFTRLENLNEILESAIGPETLFIGFSGTFLSVKSRPQPGKTPYMYEYGSGFLWCETLEELSGFLNHIRTICKRKGSDAPLVLGGSKALFLVQQNLILPAFDFYVIGKGESFFVDLILQLKNKVIPPFKEHGGKLFLHEALYEKSTDFIESITWDKADAILKGESLPLEIAKGCLYNCKFCHFDKQGSVKQEVGFLKEQLMRNYEYFGTTVYYFCDDCFNDTRTKVETICSAFLSLPFKIEWVSYARVDVAVKFPETLDLMIESGARGLFWGLESFDHKVGKKIGKGTDPELVKEMLIKSKQRHGTRVLYTGAFIIGLPGETEESIWQSNQWIIDSRVIDDVAYFPLGLRPYSERLDKAVIDYADFSRNPEKYGFKTISFNPAYWAHETMDFTRAAELKAELINNLMKHEIMSTFALSIFQYPYFRSLGLTHEQIVALYKNQKWGSDKHMEIKALEANWRKNYEVELRKSVGLT